MAKVNLTKMSLKELREIADNAAKTIESKRKEEIKKLRKKIMDEIKDNGLTPGDIFPALKTSARSAVAPKYANPGNTSETWTGRGRRPKWVEALLNEGKSLEDLAI